MGRRRVCASPQESPQQAEDLGLTRAVRISRRVPCPELNEEGFIPLNRTARLRNPEALRD